MTQETANASVYTPSKDIVASCLDEVRKDLQALVDGGCRELTIDLKNVQVIDSRGLGLFMLCYNSLSRVGGHLTVVTDSEDLRRLFEIMRMSQYVTVTGTQVAAGAQA